jgi:hypothetical protein
MEHHAIIRVDERKRSITIHGPVNPKFYSSLMSLDNIHTMSLLCFRRSRRAYKAASQPAQNSADDSGYTRWIIDTAIISLYRFIGLFVLIGQVIFLWSLLDMYAFDFHDAELKSKPPAVKFTADMTDREFGAGPLNVTIAKWDAARSADNAMTCRAWVLDCGARWAAGEACESEADIRSLCPPWDFERHLQGRNGTEPILYPGYDGTATRGGEPDMGSMTRAVILEWVTGMDPASDLYGRLAYRYALSVGNAYAAELLAILVWSRLNPQHAILP